MNGVDTRDNRDPELIGVELHRAREQHPDGGLAALADKANLNVPDFGTPEAHEYRVRGNGQVAAVGEFFVRGLDSGRDAAAPEH
jgi:hypothetical protein